jgi:hypothetical protein
MARKLAEVVVLDRRVVWHTVRGQAADAAQRKAGEKSAHLRIFLYKFERQKKKENKPKPQKPKTQKNQKN